MTQTIASSFLDAVDCDFTGGAPISIQNPTRTAYTNVTFRGSRAKSMLQLENG